MKHWQNEVLYFNSSDFFESLLESIRSAKLSVDIETFILGNDSVGQKIFELLDEKASEGVRVRLLIDGVGSMEWINSKASTVIAPHFEIKIFHPLPWPFLNWSMATRKSFSRMIGFFSNINRRSHQKMAIIDERIAYTGSLNLHQESVEWRELGIRLEDIDADLFNQLFETTWSKGETFGEVIKGIRIKEVLRRRIRERKNKNKRNIDPMQSVIRSNHSRKNRQLIFNDLVKRIRSARQKILIVTPYLVPPKWIMDSLCQAAESGVDISILTAGPTDVRLLKIIRPIYFRQLMKSGVKIYEYRDKILHAKFLSIDGFYVMGSTNLNHRSLRHDIEVDIVIENDSSKRQLEEAFLNDLEKSKKMQYEKVRFYNVFHWLLAKLLLQMKNYL